MPPLLDAGVTRISLSQSDMLAAQGQIARLASELRDTGTYRGVEASFHGFSEAEALFTAK